jgi:hypothetical protein
MPSYPLQKCQYIYNKCQVKSENLGVEIFKENAGFNRMYRQRSMQDKFASEGAGTEA